MLKTIVLCVFFSLIHSQLLIAQDLLLSWDFEEMNNRSTREGVSGRADTLEGNFKLVDGIKGNGLKLDGFTTRLIHEDEKMAAPGSEFSVEAWVSLGNYPWNWCPVLTTENKEVKGYRLMVGPHGQIAFQVAIGGQWISCTTKRLSIPLRTWMHVVGIYSANNFLKVYINGELKLTMPINGEMENARNSSCVLGMVANPEKPSDIHRTWGTVSQYYGLNGIIDEIRVYNNTISQAAISKTFSKAQIKVPDLKPHRLPDIERHPGRFGGFYTKLKYYDGWDDLWPVDQDPDIVVCFDKLPVKVVFWRGVRYGASWISGNNNWMSDQSVEAWGVGDKDQEGCFEHMQDRHCRFSHVRIIENTDARVVVHWRYALVSAYNNTWRVDPKTGWECWIDEYHYIYPDAAGIRKVAWKKGSLGFPRQFQESLPILQPGQLQSELLHQDYVHVSDYAGNIRPVSYVENPQEMDKEFARDFTVQQYNFKSDQKPFICYEPGNQMSIKWNNIAGYHEHGGCNHFPVGQARCDGRTSTTSDKPSHFGGFPISNPVIHEKDKRYFWNGLYGINDMAMKQVVELGKSWAFAPEINLLEKGYVSRGFDKSERCYHLEKLDASSGKLALELAGSKENPIINPAFVIKNWTHMDAGILIDGKPAKDARIGINRQLEGDELVVFLFHQSNEKVNITISPK